MAVEVRLIVTVTSGPNSIQYTTVEEIGGSGEGHAKTQAIIGAHRALRRVINDLPTGSDEFIAPYQESEYRKYCDPSGTA